MRHGTVASDAGISWEEPFFLSQAVTNETAIYSAPRFIQGMRCLYPDNIIVGGALFLGLVEPGVARMQYY